jgi:hypothetical protein
VLVLDNGPVHTSKASTAALATRPWITVEWLPRYAPELNDIEPVWRDLKRHHLAHRTFRDAADLDAAIQGAVADLNRERSHTQARHRRAVHHIVARAAADLEGRAEGSGDESLGLKRNVSALFSAPIRLSAPAVPLKIAIRRLPRLVPSSIPESPSKPNQPRAAFRAVEVLYLIGCGVPHRAERGYIPEARERWRNRGCRRSNSAKRWSSTCSSSAAGRPGWPAQSG